MLHIAIFSPLQFYTALSQIVARIGHSHPSVHGLLAEIVIKVVSTHPQQALWTLLALVKSSNKERAQRGATCLAKVMVWIIYEDVHIVLLTVSRITRNAVEQKLQG